MIVWERLYAANDTPWELGEASPPLVDLLRAHRERLGRVLVPGCGRGADALFVASLGADVTGWDIAPTALAAARSAAREQGLDVTFEQRDTLAPHLDEVHPFDTWIEHTFFCAIAPELRPRYVEAAATLLRAGGYLLGVFMIGNRAKGPPYGATEQELRGLLSTHFRLLRLEPATNSPGMWAGREVMIALQRR